MSGLDLARSIRHRCLDLPVVLTSGYSHVLAQDSNDNVEFLRKPYQAAQLSRILDWVTARRKAP